MRRFPMHLDRDSALIRCMQGLALLILLASTSFAAGYLPGTSDEGKDLPLKSQRSVRYPTEEGTWMSLDVSPDGTTVIFDLVGHLYRMKISGGEARAITSGMEFDSQPRFSPDGKQIVFISDRSGAENVWVGKADGSGLRRISDDQNALYVSPRWSHDGRRILVSRKKPYMYDASFELWMFDLEGGSGVQITKGKSSPDAANSSWHNALGVTQSLDQKTLFYAKRFGYFPDEGTLPLWQIASRDVVTGEEADLTIEPGGAFRPELSPDGKLLAYGTRYDGQTGLRIHDLKTLKSRWIKFPIERDDMESYFPSRDLLPGYAFFPNGQEILIAFDGKFHRLNLATGTDSLVPFHAEVLRELGPRLQFPAKVDESDVQARTFQGAAQSPSGKRLAFSTFTDIYVTELPAGTPKRLSEPASRAYQPAWSPDGQWLAYVTWENQQGNIWKVRSDETAKPQRVTTISGFYRDPAWSPDGKRIVALRDSYLPRPETPNGMSIPTGLDIVWVAAAGGEPQLIAHGSGDSRPHFGADPERVYVSSADQWPSMAPIRLTSMRWDGSDKRVVLKVTSRFDWGREMTPYMNVQVSPDEKRALTLFRGNLYLIELSQAGDGPLLVNLSSPVVPVRRITKYGADSFAWADEGKTITWYLGSTFYRMPVSDVVFHDADTNSDPRKVEDALHANLPPLHPEEFPVKLSKPRHRPTGTFALQGAKVITMRGDDVLENATVIVNGNRIEEVGPADSTKIPDGARTFDAQGKTIVPGFIDIHAHYVEIHREILDLQNWNFFSNLAYGITTGRDVQAFTPDLFAYKDLVDIGEIPGPRAYSTGLGVFYVNDFQSKEEAASVVSRYKEFYKTNTIKSYLIGNRRQRQFVVQACSDAKEMATTEGASDLKLDLTHVIDGFSGTEHVLPNRLYHDTIQLLARSGIYYTPTFLIGYGGPGAFNYYAIQTDAHNDAKYRRFVPHNIVDARTQRITWFEKNEYAMPMQAGSAAAVVRAGGNVCLGSEGFEGPAVHWALWALQSGGMTNLQALRAATMCGAEAMGLDKDMGSIEKGKLADFMVLTKDPLQDIRNTMSIQFVVKDGELFDGDTLKQIWPQEKPAPTNWWQNDGPAEPVRTH